MRCEAKQYMEVIHLSRVALAFMVLLASATNAQTPQYGAWGFDLAAMDRTVKPGDDFNRYSSGAWLDRTEIPADKPIASLRYLMSDVIETRLHVLMEAAAAQLPSMTVESKVGAFYQAFMDEKRLLRIGKAAVATEISTI